MSNGVISIVDITRSTLEFVIDASDYKIQVANEDRPDDPTLVIFRNSEEEPVAIVHLNPNAFCNGEDHIVVRDVE